MSGTRGYFAVAGVAALVIGLMGGPVFGHEFAGTLLAIFGGVMLFCGLTGIGFNE